MPAATNSASAAAVGQATQKTSDIIGNLRPSKLFKLSKPDTYVTSLSFDDSGEFLLAACNDDSLQLYNAKEGRHEKTLLSKKYGCHLARFTHHSQSIIYASTKVDDTIRYLSTHDNQFLRYFRGHTAPVTALSVSPASDTFVSCSLDDTVRLWNLNSPTSQGRLHLATPTLATFDPSASVLAIASSSTCSILLYDLRNYDKAPFATFDLLALQSQAHLRGKPVPRDWTRLEFSNDGKSLLVATNSSAGHLLLDAFSGTLTAFLVRAPQHLPLSPEHQRPAPYPPQSSAHHAHTAAAPAGQGDACFSADGRYVLGSSGGDRDAVVWDTQGLMDDNSRAMTPLAGLPCKTRASVIEWNPRYNMLATGDADVVFWLPEEHTVMRPP